MRIFNGHAGIGGNRAAWGEKHEVTACELDPAIAGVYAERFPNDRMIVGDVMEHLVEHFADYDFIWLSPPCPTHGQYRYNVGVRAKGYAPVIPDMTGLYGAIVFLQHHFRGLWAVENVKPYYEPLIAPTAILQRHLVWSNFPIDAREFAPKGIRTKSKLSDFDDMGLSLDGSGIKNKRQVFRNAVDPELGRHVLDAAKAARKAARA